MMDYGVDASALEEYSLGYRARLAGRMMLEGATFAWDSGWEDADTDRLESARHRRVVDEGLEDSYESTWGVLFDAGREARLHGIGFDEGRTWPWQVGWVRSTSASVWQESKGKDEGGHSARIALPMRTGEDPGPRYVLDLLHAEAAGRGVLRRTARTSPRAGWVWAARMEQLAKCGRTYGS